MDKPAANGLLVAIRTSHSGKTDRLEFEFGGDHPPKYRFEYVAEVHHDPSDRPIPLQGNAFIQLAFDGATLDTSPRESDMNKAQHYTGPTRITPDLPILKEVAVAGDFEGVLNFGIGLSAKSKLSFQTLDSPARVVIEISAL